MHILFSVQETISEEFTMNEDSADPSNPPLSCSTEPSPPESLVPDSNHRDIDTCSEIPRFNIVVKEEEDWDVDDTEERPDHCSESEGSPSTTGLPEQHQGNHTAKKIHFCSVCGKNCQKLSKLQIHMRTHTGEKPYSCSVCGKQFSEKGNLKKHQTLHTGEKLYSCSVCGESFSSSSILTNHQRTHTGESQVSVEECGFTPPLDIIVKEEDEDPAFAERHDHCSDSEGSPSTSGLPEQHQGNHTAKKIHFCSVCGKNCHKLSKLQIHMRTHTGEKPYSCSVCGKQFSDKGNLKKHQTVHTGEKLYSCAVCGESFSSSSILTNHQRTHTGESHGFTPALVIIVKEEEEDPAFAERPDHCSETEGSPSTSGLPEQHQGNHTVKKIHCCTVCGKNCQKLSKLQIHMRTHTGEKPYSCSVCGKQFSDKGNLKKHQTVHTGEKLYSCSVCGESFSSSSNLTKHQRTHTGESQVSVEECGFTPPLDIKVKEEDEDPAFAERHNHCTDREVSHSTSGEPKKNRRITQQRALTAVQCAEEIAKSYHHC
ncbi:oocyte zinc finger protein XlCOF22 isoform X1 [Oncorhynchus kisutch]|uniref:oocyte zinc finger protein XlCOF22 isoform X1 n=2 Tax=Oncorhynchus kisutch TaxID=8019 RepID=UPI0012DFC1BD|nr:oocyte zinc finger protein XlCOF22-like isoform X1 [Oncorhynchus kisutch]